MVAKLPSRRISDGLVLERMRCGLLPLDPVRPIGGEPVPARVAISGLALDGLSLGGDGVASEIAGGGKRNGCPPVSADYQLVATAAST